MRVWTRGRMTAPAVLLSAAAASSLAGAQSDPCAGPIHAGVELRRRRRDAEALAVFREAAAACREPRLRVQMAEAEQALGQWVPAARDLREALAVPGDPWVEHRRPRLLEELRTIEQHVGGVMVVGGVPGSEVLLDGERVAELPMVRAAPAVVGTLRLEVRRAGYYVISRSITVEAGHDAQESIEMRPMIAEQPPPTAPVVQAPALSPAAPVVATTLAAPRDTARPPPEPGSSRRAWALGLGIGAGAALVTGVVALAVRESRASAFNDNPACFEYQGAAFGGGECERAQAAVDTTTALAIGAFVAGGIAAGASIALLVAGPHRPRETARGVVRCGVGPGVIGVACGGTF